MTRILKLLPLITLAALATISGSAAAQESDGPWYSTAGCSLDEACVRADPRLALHLQADLAARDEYDRSTYHMGTEVVPGIEFSMHAPLLSRLGLAMQFRLQDSDRFGYAFLGPSFMPFDGFAFGVGPGITTVDDEASLVLASSVYYRSRYMRAEGRLGGVPEAHWSAATATGWPAEWVGIGLMIQDDIESPRDSLVGLRLELEYGEVNFFGALTGGLRGDESAGMLAGIRLAP